MPRPVGSRGRTAPSAGSSGMAAAPPASSRPRSVASGVVDHPGNDHLVTERPQQLDLARARQVDQRGRTTITRDRSCRLPDPETMLASLLDDPEEACASVGVSPGTTTSCTRPPWPQRFSATSTGSPSGEPPAPQAETRRSNDGWACWMIMEPSGSTRGGRDRGVRVLGGREVDADNALPQGGRKVDEPVPIRTEHTDPPVARGFVRQILTRSLEADQRILGRGGTMDPRADRRQPGVDLASPRQRAISRSTDRERAHSSVRRPARSSAVTARQVDERSRVGDDDHPRPSAPSSRSSSSTS